MEGGNKRHNQSTMRKVLQFIWELPQNCLGLLLRLFYKGRDSRYEDVIVRRSLKMRGGISLGRYIILNQFENKTALMHEYGHSIQSKRLGWLYLLLIGLPSIIWASLYGSVIPRTENGYYRFITEKRADKLGGVKR